MQKRWIGALLALVVLASLLVGCGARNKDNTPGEPQDGDVMVETTALTEDELSAMRTYLNSQVANSELFITYTEVVVLGGTKTSEDIYTVRYRPAAAEGDLYIATLSKTEDEMSILSYQQVQ